MRVIIAHAYTSLLDPISKNPRRRIVEPALPRGINNAIVSVAESQRGYHRHLSRWTRYWVYDFIISERAVQKASNNLY